MKGERFRCLFLTLSSLNAFWQWLCPFTCVPPSFQVAPSFHLCPSFHPGALSGSFQIYSSSQLWNVTCSSCPLRSGSIKDPSPWGLLVILDFLNLTPITVSHHSIRLPSVNPLSIPSVSF